MTGGPTARVLPSSEAVDFFEGPPAVGISPQDSFDPLRSLYPSQKSLSPQDTGERMHTYLPADPH